MPSSGISPIKDYMHEENDSIDDQAFQIDSVATDSNSIAGSVGRFKCPHPDCDKSFTRQEHLSRHKLNHWPKEIFRCSFVFPNTGLACNRTFVRKDLLVRHEKRHSKLGGRLQNHPIAGTGASASTGSYKIRRHSTAPISRTSPITTAGSAASGVLIPNVVSHQQQQQQQYIDYPQYHTVYRSPAVADAEAISAPSASTQGPYPAPIQQHNHQQIGNNNSSNLVPNTNDSRSKNSSNPNANQFFGWLFENGNNSHGNANVNNGNFNNQQNGHEASVTSNPPVPLMTPGSIQTAPLGAPNLSTSTQFNGSNSNQGYGLAQGAKPPIQQLPQVQYPPPQHQSQPVNQAPVLDSIPSSASATKMQDLFSIDFLSSDPLQTLMEELSAPAMVSQDSVSNKSPVGSVSPVNSDTTMRAVQKFEDSRRGSVKDNLMQQKSNIVDMQRQSSGAYGVDKSYIEPKKQSQNYKQKVRSSMKMVPSFFHSDPKTKYDISGKKHEEILEIINELRVVSVDDIKKSLRSFWLNFNSQNGLLHKPSFHIDEQPPILVLSLIMVGASFLGSHYREIISDIICLPLRWIIFSHVDFQPPSKTYIIQSLLLLEGYEKTSSNRYLHERSYLHHGTTIQLLRRTPSLGGHPLRLKTEEEPSRLQDPQEVYRRWIDFEMLKRVAFYAFYMDTTHAVVFGYLNLFINCNHMQLTLPCPDLVWESYDLSYEILLEYGFGRDSGTTFLSALKELIREIIETLRNAGNPSSKINAYKLKKWNIRSVFGKKILLAGIISIMFQCQESSDGDLFSTTIKCSLGLEDDGVSGQDIFSFAINYWLFQIQGSCTEPEDCFISSEDMSDTRKVSAMPKEDIEMSETEQKDDLNLLSADNNSTCKIPEYHMAQIILRIFHYDYYIYCGAPWRMNVITGNEEYNLVSRRIFQFATDPKCGGVAMIYAYQFVFQMFIDEKTLKLTKKPYNVNSDYCITRPNTLALVALLIWSYNFALYGAEVQIWENGDTESAADESTSSEEQCPENSPKENATTLRNRQVKENYTPMESFEVYLVRMYGCLNVDKSSDVIRYHNDVLAKADLLHRIPGKNHLCGMMQFMKGIFDNSYWDLGREFAKLFDNCLERSMGKSSPTCENMYKV